MNTPTTNTPTPPTVTDFGNIEIDFDNIEYECVYKGCDKKLDPDTIQNSQGFYFCPKCRRSGRVSGIWNTV